MAAAAAAAPGSTPAAAAAASKSGARDSSSSSSSGGGGSCGDGNGSLNCLKQQQQQQQAQQQQVQVQHCDTQVLRVDPTHLPGPGDAGWGPECYSLPDAPVSSSAAVANGHCSSSGSEQQAASATGGGSVGLVQALAALQRGAELLRQGLAVAMPTETVYGLAADATNAEAVARIFTAKGRPSDNPLIVHVSDMAMLRSLYPPDQQASFFPEVYSPLVAAFWPGPLTLLLPATPAIPACVTAGHATLAVRMPAHPVARALIAAAGVPLAAPSANLSGRPSPTLASHVVEDLGGRVPLVLDGGACDCGVESTVLDGLRVPPAVLRPGGVTAEQLAAATEGMRSVQVYAKHFTSAALEAAPTTPGMKYRHYSPRAPLLLLDPTSLPSPVPADAGAAEEGVTTAAAAVAAAAANGAVGASAGGVEAGAAQLEVGEALRAALRRACDAMVAQLQREGQGRIGVLRTTCPLEQPPGWVGSRVGAGAYGDSSAISSVEWAGAGSSSEVSEGEDAAVPSPLQQSATGGEPSTAPQQQQLPQQVPGTVLEYCLGPCSDPAAVARHLFAGMRALDGAGVGAIVVEGVADGGGGLAVMNRLRKAAARVVRV